MEFTSFQNKIYIFDRITKEYKGETNAPLDPVLTKNNKTPTYSCTTTSTFQKPPEVKENEIQIYDHENDSWIIKKDFRGKEYYLPTGEKLTISKIDELFPENAIFAPPPTTVTSVKYINDEWVESGLIYHGVEIKTKEDVDKVTRSLIRNLGEEKAKTEKLLAGNNECVIWDKFIEDRKLIIKEGNDFIEKNSLEDFKL
jgi:hypothetical protein